MGSQQTKADCDTLAARICELEVAAETRYIELGIVVRAVRSLKGGFAAGEHRANNAEARVRETLDRMSKLCALVNWLDGTVDGKGCASLGLHD